MGHRSGSLISRSCSTGGRDWRAWSSLSATAPSMSWSDGARSALAPAVLGTTRGRCSACATTARATCCATTPSPTRSSRGGCWLVATAGRESAKRVRLVHSLVSHASLVYDEHLFMKSYRVLEPAPRPEIELMLRLEEVGFEHTLRPVAYWERNGRDLALVREYIPGAVEGRLLALTSLRDLLGRNLDDGRPKLEDVGGAGGDLSSEVRRLGEATGSLHLALAEAFGVRSLPDGDTLRTAAIRIHGDYHLRRVFRTDAGWIVGGFGDDPLIGKSGDSTEPARAALRLAARGPGGPLVLPQTGGGRGRGGPTGRHPYPGGTAREGLGASQQGRLSERLPRRRRHPQAHRIGPAGSGGRDQVTDHRTCDAYLGPARTFAPRLAVRSRRLRSWSRRPCPAPPAATRRASPRRPFPARPR